MARTGFRRIPATRARVAIGGISHETNTFVPGRTTLEDVRRRMLLAGDAMVHAARDSQSALGGAIAELEAAGSTLLPLLFAWAPPGPLVAFAAYRQLQHDLLERLARAHDAGGVDAVVLSLHGALVAEGIDDGEGALLTAVRRVVGPETPIVVVLDFTPTSPRRWSRRPIFLSDTTPTPTSIPPIAGTRRRAMRWRCWRVAGDQPWPCAGCRFSLR